MCKLMLANIVYILSSNHSMSKSAAFCGEVDYSCLYCSASFRLLMSEAKIADTTKIISTRF